MIVTPSELESSRFGYSIARVHLDAVPDVDDLERSITGVDVAILRAPASMRALPAVLDRLTGRSVLSADHLCYWEWNPQRFEDVAAPATHVVRTSTDLSELQPLVRDSFAGYGNHYQANPLFDQGLALDGYCEWADRLLQSDHSTCVVMDAVGGPIDGFAIIDWSADTPDIRLAAMSSHAQGKGFYAHVLRSVMRLAIDRAQAPVVISTQSDNVNVMRAWARLGLLPMSTTATFHIVRRELLHD